MVNAIINYQNLQIKSIEVWGHANAGKFGNDLVCAGISAIVGGALNGLDQLHNDKVNLGVQENKINIEVIKSTQELQNLLEFLVIQLKTINIQYPKNFKIKEVL